MDVAAYYGRNYLLPRAFEVHSWRAAWKKVHLFERARAAGEIRTLADAQAVAAQLERLTVRMRRRAGTNGRLFGSVGPADIAAAVREAGGPELDRRKIIVPDPIKSAGTHRVQVRLHPEVSAAVNIEIIAG